ncbi:hypothetical protein Airi01_043790 [Actinoallomurus iriomotensis]|uniref:Uncharacterized protein n=1 Tax=Actinoallomurus iriomotensis TaxID=478107 RepID=A0A9W6RLB6_9ACTN|nr:hypothetical protein Airi01_043790 [Actinoallomurus iriomotensis]
MRAAPRTGRKNHPRPEQGAAKAGQKVRRTVADGPDGVRTPLINVITAVGRFHRDLRNELTAVGS